MYDVIIILLWQLGEDGEGASADDDESLSDWNLRKHLLTSSIYKVSCFMFDLTQSMDHLSSSSSVLCSCLRLPLSVSWNLHFFRCFFGTFILWLLVYMLQYLCWSKSIPISFLCGLDLLWPIHRVLPISHSCVPSWRMYVAYRHWPPSFTVCWQSNMLVQEITQPVWWLVFCHHWANTVEQFAWTASATGHHLRTVQTIAENVCLVSWAAASCVEH